MKKVMRIFMMILMPLFVGCDGDDSGSSSSGGGGGDGSVTISGTISAVNSMNVPVAIDGATLVIYEMMPGGYVFWGPTAIGLSYSARFKLQDSQQTKAFMVFSRSGCSEDIKSIGVSPNYNINVGGATIICG